MKGPRIGDAFGRALWDHHIGRGGTEHLIERDDGYIDGMTADAYFAPSLEWFPAERLARGRVLDIGVGAGRAALWLQERGHDVVGIDPSPLVCKTARARGVRRVVRAPIERLDPKLGPFDTMIMFGNNFGILGDPGHAARTLTRMARHANPDCRILATTTDPLGKRPIPAWHQSYHAANRARGRLPGQIRLRVRYRDEATPWFDWMLVSKRDMARILHNTPWRIARTLDGPRGGYVAVIELRS